MKRSFRTILFMFASIVAALPVAAEEWRGIVPMRSTRQDVVRLLGQCAQQSSHCDFSLPAEDVYIRFSDSNTCSDKVPVGTVLLIERELITATSLAALGVDDRRFKTFDPSWPRKIGYQGYIDEKAGLLLKALNGGVFQLDYIPTAEDRRLCPDFYRTPKRFVEAVVEHVPGVFVLCPPNDVTPGVPITITAQHSRSGLRVTLNWEVTAGRILDGQGRRDMTLDTTGLDGQTITVTVERADSHGGGSFASCTVKISAAQQDLSPRLSQRGPRQIKE